ncbi:MAG: aldo/keto reductase [Bacillota bacterium]
MEYSASKERYENMNYNSCGKSGLKLPAVSLGLWQNFGTHSNFENMQNMCRAAFDNGIVHFDLANNYGPDRGSAEENFGKIMKGDFVCHRDELCIATKAGFTMWDGPYGIWGSKKHMTASLDQSLGRMGLDYVDIFYHHRPDPETPLEETMGALDQIVKSGKALYIGLSNYDGATMEKASKILTKLNCPFVINQNRYSIFDRTIEENGLKDACKKTGKGIIAFSPLAQGMLAGRYKDGIPEGSRVTFQRTSLTKEQAVETQEKVVKLTALAESRGQTIAQMALSWVLADKVVSSVLIGASRPEQIIENAKIANQPKLTKSELAKIDKICGIEKK